MYLPLAMANTRVSLDGHVVTRMRPNCVCVNDKRFTFPRGVDKIRQELRTSNVGGFEREPPERSNFVTRVSFEKYNDEYVPLLL